LPAMGCRTFGRDDFMRVPCPAANKTAVIFIYSPRIIKTGFGGDGAT
jgi:hypothetical protein